MTTTLLLAAACLWVWFLVFASTREGGADLVYYLCEALAVPFGISAQATSLGIDAVLVGARNIVEGLRRRNVTGSPEGATIAWETVIGALLMFALGMVAASGEATLISLRIAAALGLIVGQPAHLEWLTAMAFWSSAAIWGEVAWSTFERIPHALPGEMGTRTRRAVIGLALLCCVLAVTASILLFIWGQTVLHSQAAALRAVAEGAPPATAGGNLVLADAFMGIFAALLTSAVLVAVRSTKPALLAILALLFGLVLLISWILLVLLVAIVTLLDATAAVVTAAITIPAEQGRGLRNWFTSFRFARALHLTPLPEFRPRRVVYRDVAWRLKPHPARGKASEGEQEHTEELSMFETQRSIIVAGSGILMRKLGRRLGPKRLTLAKATWYLNRGGEAPSLAAGDILDLSLAPAAIREAFAACANAWDAELRLCRAFVDGIVGTAHRAGVSHPTFLWIEDSPGDAEFTAEVLRELKRRLPRLVTMVITYQGARANAAAGEGLFAALHREAIGGVPVVDAILVLSPTSPFAMKHGEEALFAFVARGLNSALEAHSLYPDNVNPYDLIVSLRGHGWYSLAVASEGVNVGHEHVLFRSLRGVGGRVLNGRRGAGYGSLGDLVIQSKSALGKALTDPAALVMDGCQVGADGPFWPVFTTPLDPRDRRFAGHVAQVRPAVVSANHNALPLFSAGAGTPYPLIGGDYIEQVTVIWPLPLADRDGRPRAGVKLAPPKERSV